MLPFPHAHILSGPAICCLLVLVSCRKDPPAPDSPDVPMQAVKLTVKPTWNGAPFNKNAVYTSAAGQLIHVGLVKFYLSPLDLVAYNGTVRLSDADLFDVTNGPLHRMLTAPIGDYQTLKTGLGLPPAINHRDITSIPANAPTGNNSGMYWTWASMYRFMLFEGHFDTDLGNTGELPYNFSLHTGLDTCYRTRSIPINLHVDGNDTAHLTVLVDISRFFTNGTDTLDLTQGASWHGEVDNIGLAIKVANLESAAITVE